MTFVFGRKKLVISLISDQPGRSKDRFPMVHEASDRELERLSRSGIGPADRYGRDVQRVMHGAGWVR